MAFLTPFPLNLNPGQFGAFHRSLYLDGNNWSVCLPTGQSLNTYVPNLVEEKPFQRGDEQVIDPNTIPRLLNFYRPEEVRDAFRRLHQPVVTEGDLDQPVFSVEDRRIDGHVSVRYVDTEPKYGTLVVVKDSVGFLMASEWNGENFGTGVVFLILPEASLIETIQRIRHFFHLPEVKDPDGTQITNTLIRNFHSHDATKKISVVRESELPALKILNQPQGAFPGDDKPRPPHVLLTLSAGRSVNFTGQTSDWINKLLELHMLYQKYLNFYQMYPFFRGIAAYVRKDYIDRIRAFNLQNGTPIPPTLLEPLDPEVS